VLDTNVLVSAFLKKGSIPSSILVLMERGDIYLCVSKEIMDEYEGILRRTKFQAVSEKTLNYLRRTSRRFIWVTPKEKITAVKEDPADNKFLECAVEAKADYLITGNIKHFPLKGYRQTAIVMPKEFIDLITKCLFEGKKRF
jgi:putative PIN family toxin of toxin-antitoxin system